MAATSHLDRLAELESKLERALRNPALSRLDKEILSLLAGRQGLANAIKAADIAALLSLPEGEPGRRVVTKSIETLVQLARIPVGASKVEPMGYFLVVSSADHDRAVHHRWSEVYAHLRYLRVLTSKEEVATLFGQAQLDFDEVSHRGTEAQGRTA